MIEGERGKGGRGSDGSCTMSEATNKECEWEIVLDYIYVYCWFGICYIFEGIPVHCARVCVHCCFSYGTSKNAASNVTMLLHRSFHWTIKIIKMRYYACIIMQKGKKNKKKNRTDE